MYSKNLKNTLRKRLLFFCLPQDQGGFGIAISEEDTTNGVVIKSLTDHGAAAKV